MLVAGPMLIKAEEFSQQARKVSGELILCGDHVLDHLVGSQFLIWSEAPWQLRLRLLALY